MTPARAPLVAYRWTPFDETIPFRGVDFTGATFAMEVRPYRDATGTALIALANTSSGQGISVSVSTVAGLTTSSVNIRINETTIEGLLPFPGNGVGQGAAVELVYDLHITGGGFGKRRWLEGPFIIEPGVTH